MKMKEVCKLTLNMYSMAKRGTFSKIQHPSIHKKLSEYIDKNHSGATCSNLLKTESGWSCIVRHNRQSFVLFINKEGGTYSFWEKQI